MEDLEDHLGVGLIAVERGEGEREGVELVTVFSDGVNHGQFETQALALGDVEVSESTGSGLSNAGNASIGEENAGGEGETLKVNTKLGDGKDASVGDPDIGGDIKRAKADLAELGDGVQSGVGEVAGGG